MTPRPLEDFLDEARRMRATAPLATVASLRADADQLRARIVAEGDPNLTEFEVGVLVTIASLGEIATEIPGPLDLGAVVLMVAAVLID